MKKNNIQKMPNESSAVNGTKPHVASSNGQVDWNAKRIEIADFIYLSMCVDGFVKFDSFIDDLDMVRHGKKLTGMLFEVTDKKRGKFYIGWMV